MSKPFLLTFLIFVLLLLALRFVIYFNQFQPLKNGQKVIIKQRLWDEPELKSGKEVLAIKIKGERVNIFVPFGANYHYGDSLLIAGTISKKVLSNKQQAISIYSPHITRQESPWNFLFSLLRLFRQRVSDSYQKTLPEPEAALLLGIVFGIKEQIPADFSLNLRQTGVVHVVAASGMNVSLVAAFLLGVFSSFLKRKQALMISLLGVFLYCLLSGLEPSIMRAGLMLGLVFTGSFLGRQTSAFISLFLAGFFMLLWDPILLFDTGFELSILSTFGILYFTPIFNFSTQNIFINFLKEDGISTFSSQIMTLPILVFKFSNVAVLSFPANLFLLWIIAPLMILGGLASLILWVSPFLANILLFLALPFLWFFVKTVNLIAGFSPHFSLNNFSWGLVASYYLFLAAFLSMRIKKHE